MSFSSDVRGSVGRVERVYAAHHRSLRRIVASNLTIDESLLDDACQYAWACLQARAAEVAEGSELPWLVTTATREALRLMRRRRSEMPFSALDDSHPAGPAACAACAVSGPEQALDMRERILELRELPERQRRVLWLKSTGYDYDEISAATGVSLRTVERQLQKARRRLAS